MDGKDFVYGQNWINQLFDALRERNVSLESRLPFIRDRRLIDSLFAWHLSPQGYSVWYDRNIHYHDALSGHRQPNDLSR